MRATIQIESHMMEAHTAYSIKRLHSTCKTLIQQPADWQLKLG
jgi:hypothetical protein